MTATAPQPQRAPQAATPQASWQTRPVPARAPTPAAQQGGVKATRRARRRPDASSTPARLRVARGVAAAVCLLPGTAALVALTSAATADPATAPALVRADVNRHAVMVRVDSEVAWATGSATNRVDVAEGLTAMAAAIGRAEVVRPDWAPRLADARSTVAAESATVLPLLAGRPTTGATPAIGNEPGATPAEDTAGAARLQASLQRIVKAPETLPPLTDVTGNEARRAVVLGASALAVLGLAGASVWLARKTRRVVNPGLALALLGAVAIGGVAGQTLAGMVTSSTAETVAGLRVNAAAATAAEASALLPGVTPAAAAAERAPETSQGTNKVKSVLSGTRTETAWSNFNNSTLLRNDVKPTVAQVQQRLTALNTLDAVLTTEQAKSAGTASTLPTVLGYGLFAMSLLAAAAAWTGVGRRLAEYR